MTEDELRRRANEYNRRYRATPKGRETQRLATLRWRAVPENRVALTEADRLRESMPERRAQRQHYNHSERTREAKRAWAASPAGHEAARRANAKRRVRAAGVVLCIRVEADYCGICLEPLQPGFVWPHPLSTTLGHEPPLAATERDGWLVVVERPEHWRCNHIKRDRTDLEMASQL